MSENVLEVTEGVARNPAWRMKKPVTLRIAKGEQIAIVGRNGAGKTLLTDMLRGRYPLLSDNEVKYDFTPAASSLVSDNIKCITFRDSYGEADGTYYYQQRWNAHDIDDTPLVRELLPASACSDAGFGKMLYDLFGMEDLLDKQVILLSSGELRKLQLIKSLLGNPRILIIDNPFIGLDVKARATLRDLLGKLTRLHSLQVILVLSKSDDIPSFITHVIPVEDRVCGRKVPLQEYLALQALPPKHLLDDARKEQILSLPCGENPCRSDSVVQLHGVSIRYGERTILDALDWQVRCGEKWALSGDNGSGKSTLLSLVCADNPQSYACDISLFGRKRGSGESIWEIKKHIGYVSPEMHRAYLKNLPAIDIVASGLHDSIGLYRKSAGAEYARCEWWMDIFGIKDLKDRNFLQLSSGEQRMVLLARAFVKDPELLVLDEPLHGLDLWNRRLVKDVIETFCRRPGKTLIIVTHYADELPEGITHTLYLKRTQK